ncbi:MAG: O-antigen ligase family protein [Bacteroidales bacterium]|nr:O-antigen ligase family protein [Bacteroidales bacterium]
MFKREKIITYLLIVPVLLRWMPFRQFSLTFDFMGFPVFWPTIFFILYLVFSPNVKTDTSTLQLGKILKIGLLYSLLVLLLHENGFFAIELFIQNLLFYLVLFAFVYKPLSDRQLGYLKWIIVSLYFYILIQAMLSATGVWQIVEVEYESSYMSFYRARTKAGDSNQTALILTLFTYIITGYYSFNKSFKYFVLFLSFATISMIATRGSLLALSLYAVAFLYINLKRSKYIYKIFIIIFIFIGSYVTIKKNLISDVLLRTTELAEDGNISANRDILIYGALNTAFKDSPIFGVGQGRVYPSTKDLARMLDGGKVYSKYLTAPHNVWILFLCEYGIVGFLVLLIIIIKILNKISYKNVLFWSLFAFFSISMNTESVIVHDEVLVFVCILITCAIRSSRLIAK